MKKTKLNQCDTKGFTLIEMAVVMLISGIMLSLMGSALMSYLKKSRVQATEFRISEIQEAVNQYLSINRRYPCPARRDRAPGDTAPTVFGREVGTDCRAAIAGTAGSGDVIIGSVPTRDLNLPDDFAFDGWGRRYTYAVTRTLASIDVGGTNVSLYEPDGGLITVQDSAGNDITTTAHYVILSHGLTGQGSFTFSGNPFTTCGGTMDSENCNDDDTFLITLVNNDALGATFFDDYLQYQGQAEPLLFIPAGAVMAFNLDVCPPGWVDYAPAEGRFIIGANNGIVPAPAASHPEFEVSVGAGSSAGDYPLVPEVANQLPIDLTREAATNAPDISGIPPYVALRYCEKLPE